MLGKLFKQASSATLNELANNLRDPANASGTPIVGPSNDGIGGNRNINNVSPALPQTSKLGPIPSSSALPFNGTIQIPPPVFTAQNASSPISQSPSYTSDDSYSKQSLYGTVNNIRHSNLQYKFFRLVVCQDGGNLRSKQVLYDSAATEGSLPPPSPASMTSQNSCFTPSTPSTPPANLSSTTGAKSKGMHHHNMIGSKIHHPISEINDYMFGGGLPSTETNCITKVHLLPKLSSLAHGSNNSLLVTRLFLITSGEPSATQNEPAVYKMSEPDSWNPTAALPTREVFFKSCKSSTGATSNSGISNSSSCSSNGSTMMGSSKNVNISSKFAIGIVIPLDAPEEDLMDILVANWDEISHYLILFQKVISKKLVTMLKHSIEFSNNGSSPYITNTKRIQFPSWILQHDPDLLHQYFKLIKLIAYDTNLPRLINSNALIKSSIFKTSSKYNSLLLNWVLEVLNWLEFKDNKQLAKPSIQTTTSSKSTSMSLTTVSTSISFNNKGPTQSSNAPFLTSSPLKQANELNSSSHPFGVSSDFLGITGNATPNQEVSRSYHTFLATLFSLVLPIRERLATKPICDNTNDDEINRKHKDVNRIVIMTGNPAVAKKLIFILNALIPDDKLYDSCKLDFTIVDEDDEVLFEDDEYSVNGEICTPTSNIGGNTHTNITADMTPLVPTASANSATTTSIKSPLTQKFLYTSSDDLPGYLDSSPGVQTVKESLGDSDSISKSPTVEPIPIRSSHRSSGESLGSRASDQSLRSGWEIPYKATPLILTTHKHSSNATTSNVETSTATALVIPISYNPPQSHQQQLNYYHRNGSILKSSSYAYLSSSLNSSLSSLASQFSLSKLGGSFLEKWKWSSSNNSNNSLQNPSGANSALTPNASHSNNYFGQQNLNQGQNISNPHKLNLSSLINQGGNNVNGNYTYNPSFDTTECLPPMAIGSLTKRSSVHSLRTPSPAMTDHFDDLAQLLPPVIAHHAHHLVSTPKLSRTQSMYELYNKTSHLAGIYDNSSGVLAIKDKLVLKRSSNSAYLPLVDDTAVKNVVTHNSNFIRRKCIDIMNSKTLKISTNNALNALQIPLHSGRVHDESVLVKKKPLLPVVAFADEFRPEFTIQSCPMSGKLENQILVSMKNDVLFYQNHCQYESVTSRTIFVSLRARELKVLEMTGTSNQNSVPSNTEYEGLLASISNEGLQAQYTPMGVSPLKSGKVNGKRKVSSYTSSKPLTQSERRRISTIDSIFDEIAQLVGASQAKLARSTEVVTEEDNLEEDEFGRREESPGMAGFDEQLSTIMKKLFA